jgi:hypothetical protein
VDVLADGALLSFPRLGKSCAENTGVGSFLVTTLVTLGCGGGAILCGGGGAIIMCGGGAIIIIMWGGGGGIIIPPGGGIMGMGIPTPGG